MKQRDLKKSLLPQVIRLAAGEGQSLLLNASAFFDKQTVIRSKIGFTTHQLEEVFDLFEPEAGECIIP